MKIGGGTWILIMAALVLASFGLSFIQGWLKIQLLYFVILVAVVVVVAALAYRKENTKIDIVEAKEIAEDTLRGMDPNIMTESGGKLEWISRVADNKRFSSRGKIFDSQYDNTPSKAVVQIDARTGEVVNVALQAKPRDPPFFADENEDTSQYDPYRKGYRKAADDRERKA